MAATTTTSTRRKKLYYDILITTTNAAAKIINFCAGTGPNFGGASADRYGNVMEPNRYAGVATGAASIQRRCRQAIGAWFAPSVISMAAPIQRNLVFDFVAQGSTAIVDPATQLRPRLRVRMTGGNASGVIFAGTVYIQRQHSIEV